MVGCVEGDGCAVDCGGGGVEVEITGGDGGVLDTLHSAKTCRSKMGAVEGECMQSGEDVNVVPCKGLIYL